ncbi:YbaB/EbfC family nucleoid-associated protein [Nonomuraea sp. B12E4]|uniref:YbaB/EbfC family nucleoid-associated protein n=1 Tax=Nonomuraea sp. B12E4 TaxID=3153564 RepID=UPI00325E5289
MFGYDIDPRNIRSQDLDLATEQVDQAEALLAGVEESLSEIIGVGDSGHVRATATAEGRILEVVLGQQAVKKGSEALSEEILAAVGRAQDDARRQAETMLREEFQQAVPDVSLDPIALQEQLSRFLD